ncbi:MAG TPA: phosphoglycerate mutase [Ramlibacter sp.]|nr:phosphoglycerate mutase [Ramlibacter sp.]
MLEKLLARLRPAGSDEGEVETLSPPHERVLARELGLPDADGCIPWAAHEKEQPGAWGWITPCHWQVGRDNVAMAPPQQLHLAQQDSRTLLAAMRPYFEQDGIALEFGVAPHWHARGEIFRDLATASLDRVVGREIGQWLPRGDVARTIRRLQQEMQMLLYTHPVNDERAARGLAPVNSFWVSGTGALPGPRKQAPAGLRVVHELREAALLQDWPTWSSAWQQVDARDCANLLAAFDKGEQVSLTLCGERNARTFSGAGVGFFGKLAAMLKAGRIQAVLESL